ncbi:hypothetical protein GGI00_001645, partial [Coemansia sp. RSA 2681]
MATRRKYIYSEVSDWKAEMSYVTFVGKLGLPLVSDPFAQIRPDLFQSLAKSAPAFDYVTMSLTSEATPSGKFAGADFYAGKNEAALTAYFKQLVASMEAEAKEQNAVYELAGESGKLVPKSLYNLCDFQWKPVSGETKHKMDFAFTHPGLEESMDNVHIVAEAKRVAIFDEDPDKNIKAVRLTMARLYYLITLPTERFGHFCDVSDGNKDLRFVHRSDDSVLATAESLPSQVDDSVSLSGYCKRHVRPRGRLAHVFRTTYKGMDAFLKLSWTPVDRMPEGAVYDILRRTGVDGIPLVLASGLLKEDLFGYRLEYLVLEDCGSSVAEYLKRKHSDGLHSDELGSEVVNIVRATLRCLVQARVKGNVLHRDVSMGNIMVGSGGTVKVIDWGYAKVIDEDSLDSGDASTTGNWEILLAETESRWRYASEVVMRNEEAHDPLTGTPLYMSIPVLAGAKVRGLADDIESLFYVVMDALSELQPKKDDAACGFEARDHRTQAMVRAGCLSSVEIFPRFFGISSCSDRLRQLLRDLRGFLFVNSSGYIASDLIVAPSTERGTAIELLKDYADQDTMPLLGHREAFTPR